MRWLVCLLPPIAFIFFEETPGLSGLDGINAAGLFVLSPLVLILGFAVMATIVGFARWLSRRFGLEAKAGFTLMVLVLVGLLSPIAYLDRDWLLLAVIELAALPVALLLAPTTRQREPPTGQT